MALPRDLKDLPTDLLDRAGNMTLFSRDVSLLVGGETIPAIDFALITSKPEIGGPELLTALTTNITISDEIEPLSADQEEELANWWTEMFEREMRRLCGQSEYEQCLRAAGATV